MMQRLDASGLACPLPVLKARKRLAAMAPDEMIEVITTDAMSVVDLPVFCAQAGHRIVVEEKILFKNSNLSENAAGGHFRFVIQRRSGA